MTRGSPQLPEPLRSPRYLEQAVHLVPDSTSWHRPRPPRFFGGRSTSMARSDLLINLVKAGASGDQVLFRRTVDALVAEERGKNHSVLAERLSQAAGTNGKNGHSNHAP